MAAHSSTLAWKIPWTEEPGRLQSMGSLGVRYDWSDLAATEAAFTPSHSCSEIGIPVQSLEVALDFIFSLVSSVIGLSWWLTSKESACLCRRCEFDPWVRKIPWRRNGNPLHCSCLGNPMDRGAWQGCSPWSHKELDMTSRINNKLSDAGKVLFRFSASKSLILESTDASRGWKAYIPHLPFWNGFSWILDWCSLLPYIYRQTFKV